MLPIGASLHCTTDAGFLFSIGVASMALEFSAFRLNIVIQDPVFLLYEYLGYSLDLRSIVLSIFEDAKMLKMLVICKFVIMGGAYT